MKNIIRMHFSLFCLLLILTAPTGIAWANVAANTQIINNATLTYNDGTGVKTATASVTVKVALAPAPPNIAPGPNQSTPYSGPTTNLTNTFTVTASANGPDTYNITSAITASTNTSGAAATPQAPTVYLGATVTVTGSSTTVIVVPSDGVNDGKVNGIQTGSVVVIGSDTRTVQSVVDNPSGTSTITLTAALSAAPLAGVLVAEQKTVLVDVKSGTISTPGANVTVSKNVTITSTTNSGITVTSGAITDTYTSGTAKLDKYVRNVTTLAAGTGTVYPYNSVNYYPSGIFAKPTETLEYILVATNTGGGPVTVSVITDLVPVDYLTLKTAVYSGKDITYVNEAGTASQLTAAAGDDAATYNAVFDTTPNAAKGQLTVNVGTGAGIPGAGSGGSIAIGANVKVLYQVTVK